MTFEYTKGAAYLYGEWLKFQDPDTRLIAERFRPWETYELEDTEDVVSILRYAADGSVTIRIAEGPDTGEEIEGVDPNRLELTGCPALDDGTETTS